MLPLIVRHIVWGVYEYFLIGVFCFAVENHTLVGRENFLWYPKSQSQNDKQIIGDSFNDTNETKGRTLTKGSKGSSKSSMNQPKESTKSSPLSSSTVVSAEQMQSKSHSKSESEEESNVVE